MAVALQPPESPTVFSRPDLLDEPGGAHDYPGHTSFLDPSTPGYSDTDWKTMAALQSSRSPSEAHRSLTPRTDSFQHSDLLHKHLLVETAVFDSSKYDILAIDEVDALKKEKVHVDLRIEASRRKLTLESKVRDAARSLHRLYSQKGHPDKQRRRSVLGDRRPSTPGSDKSDNLGQAGDELQTSSKKVEELVHVLVDLENRRQYIESRLLRHTAAVLQAAHNEREAKAADGTPASPGPESLPYVRDYDEEVHGKSSKGNSPTDDAQLADVNTRLMLLNGQMRSLISQAKKGRQDNTIDDSPDDIPSAYPEDEDPAARMNSQLEHLQKSIFSLVDEHKRMSQTRETMLNDTKHDQHATEGRLESVNNQLYSILTNSADGRDMFDTQPPPPISGNGAQQQINYLEESLLTVEQMMQQSEHIQDSHKGAARELEELRTQADMHAEKSSQYESVMLGLWEMLHPSGHDRAGRRARSDDEDGERATAESFSVQAFNTRVQHLFARANELDSQAETLRRQIQQQRDLAGRTDADDSEKAEELQAAKRREQEAVEELEAHRSRIGELEEQIGDLENGIAEHRDEARIASIESQHRETEHQERLDELTESLAHANAAKETVEGKLALKEAEMEELEPEMVRLTTELTMARAELDGAYGSRSERAREMASHPEFQELEQKYKSAAAELEKLQLERRSHEAEMADLLNLHQKAESRSAALVQEMMTLREIQAASTRDDGRMRTLEKELADMATDYQELTRETVEMEREREKVEGVVDALRDRIEAMEMQLGDEKVKWLGVRSPGGTPDLGGTRETTSTMVLRNEFKKMMRETRAEGVKLLRAEQEQRRQVEAQLRNMRREKNGGLSPRLGTGSGSGMASPGLRVHS